MVVALIVTPSDSQNQKGAINTSFPVKNRKNGIKKYGVYTKGDSQEGENKVKSVEKPVFNRVYPDFGRCKNN